ncbi:MAG: N-acetylmuramoyl-L-alanine amidase [Coriobacteriales bacterium]|nr:N-acetylmuramoyl-L-alanine amidase [Coriobacteriales bacterium]
MLARKRVCLLLCAVLTCGMLALYACAQRAEEPATANDQTQEQAEAPQPSSDTSTNDQVDKKAEDKSEDKQREQEKAVETSPAPSASDLREELDITELYHDELAHGEKPAECQKYIVLHDTEGGGTAQNVVDYWLSAGKYIAAHFVINKDGSIVQCVPMDQIAHHAGFGNTGHNQEFGVQDESRDDKRGTTPVSEDLADYGMNSYSIGIEMIHDGSTGEEYPAEQLEALDKLIAYIDAYYGEKSEIIDHKTWRLYNSDCSKEFEEYLHNYQQARTHDGSRD